MLLALAALSLLMPIPSQAFTVTEFHPQGTVRSPRQVRAVFSEPIVSFGDPRGLEPFQVDCSQKGKGLWEDTRTWIYEFPKELTSGESCQFKGKKELKSDKGGAWTGQTDFTFETGGPAIKRTDPYEGGMVDQQAAFLLYVDGPVDHASVEKNAYLMVEGIAERIPVKVLSEKIRKEILERTNRYRHYEGDEYGEESSSSADHSVAIEATRMLPPDKRVQLVWGKGIRSPKGAVTTQDQMLAFRSEKEFTVSFSCGRESENAPCLPIGDMTLRFSAPIDAKLAEKVTIKAGKFALKANKIDKDNTVSYVSFSSPFPPKTKFIVSLPRGIKDDAGRPLANENKFPLEVSTGDYPPLAKFAAPFGILEASDPVMPITLRKVEAKVASAKIDGAKLSVGADDPLKLMNWVYRLKNKDSSTYRMVNGKEVDPRGESILAGEASKQKFELPKPNGAAAFEVIGIPLEKKGFHVVEVQSQLLGKSLMGQPKPMYVASGALVTNLAVHLKWGNEASLIWVTSLDKGQPVSGAKVRAVDCTGKVVWQGKTDDKGTVLTEDFPKLNGAAHCSGSQNFSYGLVVVAEKEGDFSLVYSGWDDGIESWRFNVATGGDGDESMVHTVFDRTLFQAGQTAHMKHFLRERFLRGIRFSKKLMPKSLVILHSTGKKIVMPVTFNASGVAENEWKIPKEANLGGYTVYLSTREEKPAKGQDGEEEGFSSWGPGVYQSGGFRVEEFRLPVMAGSVQWPKGALTAVAQVPVDINVRYLSGGGASGLAVKLRSRATRLEGTSFAEFEGYRFSNGGVKVGRFSRGNDDSRKDKGEKIFADQKLSLDAGGGARALIKDIPSWDQPTQLSVEAEYRDPNGEIQNVSRSTTMYPGGALVGIKPDGWVAQKDKVKFRVAVVNPEGKPLAGANVKVNWLERQSFSHRKRIVGGFYAYDGFEEVKEKGAACSGSTNEKGLLFCEGAAPATGNLILVAETSQGGKASRAHHDVYVAGADQWWFGQENDDRIDILPEKKAYEPGETARFQVRSPFRSATALVTIEREGVIESFIRQIDGKDPVIELPIKDSYAPNVFVSALLVRGRVGEPQATALVDLARPAHKLGIAAVNVGWKAHRLNVKVDADKAEYRVRDKAKVKVKVERAIDGKPAAQGEVLLLAVDEALLELMPNRSWELLEAMMGPRSLKVQTSTAQSQVIGKRHFGLKAMPPGGGGGQSSARELFDSLLYWKATLPLNANGEVEAEVPMNDSLSSFRLVAIASEQADRFGTGAHSIRTRQDLMLFSGVSPLARHGDKANPEVTVRNSSDRSLKAEVSVKVDGAALGKAQTVELAAGASKTLSWPQVVPKKAQQAFEFSAQSGEARDLLKITQKLEAPLRESVIQATLERLDGKLSVPVEKTKGSLPDTGGITVKLTKSLAANLEGVRRYMSDYSYNCLEQQVSRAVALRDSDRWKGIAGNLSSYIDGAGLLKYFPESIWGSDSLTSYFLSVSQEAGYAIPEGELKRLVQGLQGFVTGKYYYAGFVYPAADLAIRKLAAMEALSRYQSFEVGYLSAIQIQPDLWPISAVLNWYSLLQREQNIPDREKKIVQAQQIIRSKLEWRGTVVGFKGGASLWWLMSSMDEEANRLLLAASSIDHWKEDIGRLVRGSIARQRQGHWDLTTANAWGVLAMERFSAQHEKDPVSGSSESSYGGKKQSIAWADDKSAAPMVFPWAPGKSDLSVGHSGGGKPWAFLEARAAVKLEEPIFKGYRLTRTIRPIEQKSKGSWSVGDVYRVTIEIMAPADMTWVAISDPIPAGATVLGSGLGNDSATLTKDEKQKGYSWGTFEERSFSGFRSYQEYMPKGSHQIEYTVRLNAAGTFQLPNTRIEAMYAPEMYAESPNETLTVR